MRTAAEPMAISVTGSNVDLEQEFESRLVESSTLAFRVAYSVVRHRQDAEDVAQEAFARAYRSFHQLRDRDRFRAWLVRMTWRLALDYQRGRRRRQARESAVDDAEGAGFATSQEPSAAQSLIARERAERLWAAIDSLPEKLRVAIVLSNMEGHDVSEVARLLDVPVGTIKSRLFLARQRLKELLQ